MLNRILRENHGKKIAVIENEFGEIGIDASLVEDTTKDLGSSSNSIVLMKNGCLCCTIRDDLVDALQDILNRHLESPLDGVIIEATGVALPSPIAETFFTSAYVKDCFEIQSFVAMIDAANFETQMKHSEDTLKKQVAFADLLVLNKTDAVEDEKKCVDIKKHVRSINSTASLLECSHADIDVTALFDPQRGGSFNLETVESELTGLRGHHHHHDHDHHHDHHHHHHHHHTDSTSSVSLSFEGDLDPSKLESFFATLLQTYGATTLYRSKGIFSLKDEPKRFVMQSVQELYSGDMLGAWDENETRTNRVVFIGQDLNRDQLESDLRSCIHQ